MRTHQNSLRNVLLAAVAILVAAIFVSVSLASPGRGGEGREPGKPSGKNAGGPDQRRTLLQAWKQGRRVQAGRSPSSAQAFGGTAAVGRPSMVINNAGTVLYTKQFAGSACDPDDFNASFWNPSTSYAANDDVKPTTGGGGFIFRATNAGTSGASEPAWPTTFGATIVDGTITWQAQDQAWHASQTYPAGVTVRNATGQRFGFTFQAVTGGTTAATEPHWPTQAGALVVDGTVTWKARGFYPGSFKGCDPMQLISRASGGAETILLNEGDAFGASGSQFSGWAEFYALNNAGKAAFRTAVMGRLSDRDEGGSGIEIVGPGPGVTEIAASNTTIGGRGVCGFSAMVGMNDAGQVLYDGYTTSNPLWQANHAFAVNSRIMPTSGIGVQFFSAAGGTSGATEPVWPQSVGATVTDGTITWTAQPTNFPGCGEDRHGIYRWTSGPGNQLLIALGTDVGGGTTVVGFGNDVVPATGNCGGPCNYDNIDGFLNPAGHASVVVKLSTGDNAAYLLTGPLTFTQVARTGGAGPGGTFGRIYPRTTLNSADRVLFKASVGGVDKMLRWTGPATYATVASVGDDVGLRSGGAASGDVISDLGYFGDINASGNVVFQATINDAAAAYYFWDGTTGLITEIAREGATFPSHFASEMVTINDSNVVAFTSGAGPQETVEQAAELVESGLHLWTKTGGVQTKIVNGDTVNGFSVTGVQAQHPTFRKRQLNSVGCVATQFLANGADPEDNAEGNGPNPRFPGVAPGPQLFVACIQGLTTPTPTVTGTPPFTRTLVFTPVPGAAAGIPTLSGSMLALFGLALVAAASLVLLTRRR